MDPDKPDSANRFINTMAERLGTAARAATIFSEPVERDGVTVIPVGKARWAFGGGAGQRGNQEGGGGGGAVQVTPVGFIEIKNGRAEFHPIRTNSIPLLILGGLSTLLLLSELKRLK